VILRSDEMERRRSIIGKLVDLLPPAPTDGTDDNRSLIYDVFLATPLLPSGALYREVKFSGNEQPGNNEDMIGRVVLRRLLTPCSRRLWIRDLDI